MINRGFFHSISDAHSVVTITVRFPYWRRAGVTVPWLLDIFIFKYVYCNQSYLYDRIVNVSRMRRNQILSANYNRGVQICS